MKLSLKHIARSRARSHRTAGRSRRVRNRHGYRPISEGDKVPASVARKLEAKLKMVLSHAGVAAGDYDCQFFLAGRFDTAYGEAAPGLSGRVLMKTDLQLAICDGSNQKVFATATFPLKGVGGSEEQALTKALSSLNAKNPEFINFVEKERPKSLTTSTTTIPLTSPRPRLP